MKPIKLIALKESEFKNFPAKFEIRQKVFSHYFNLGFTGARIGSIGKNVKALNDAQKALCYHFVCEGMIGNSGVYGILLETRGEFNEGYSRALELSGNKSDKKIFDEIASIYRAHEEWFSKLKTPPALNSGSKNFDSKLSKRIKQLERKWYASEEKRNEIFNAYFMLHKEALVQKK